MFAKFKMVIPVACPASATADDVFDFFTERRQALLREITTNPLCLLDLEALFPSDRGCKATSTGVRAQYVQTMRCRMCDYLSRLTNNTTGEPFTIETGQRDGEQYQVQRSKRIDHAAYKFSVDDQTLYLDPWVHGVIVALLVEQMHTPPNLLVAAYLCGNDAVLLFKVPYFETEAEISESRSANEFCRLLIALLDAEFVLRVTDQTLVYGTSEGLITVGVSGLRNASMTIPGNLRFYLGKYNIPKNSTETTQKSIKTDKSRQGLAMHTAYALAACLLLNGRWYNNLRRKHHPLALLFETIPDGLSTENIDRAVQSATMSISSLRALQE